MKFYAGNSIDKQGRVCLGDLIEGNCEVAIYMTETSDVLVYIVPCDGITEYPEYAIRRVDYKKRVCLPKWARGNANRVLMAEDLEGGKKIVLKLVTD